MRHLRRDFCRSQLHLVRSQGVVCTSLHFNASAREEHTTDQQTAVPEMSSEAAALNAFASWAKESGIEIEAGACELTSYHAQGMGHGLRAVRDIKADEKLFSIPRSMLFNLRNCELPALIKEAEEKDAGASSPSAGSARWAAVEEKWASLILGMMWQDYHKRQAGDHKWSAYFDVMDKEFTTPMFWSEAELQHLQGTSVPSKIGKEEAEQDYNNLVVPLIRAHPTIFLGQESANDEAIAEHYPLERYHMMGSRVLSRSFHVEPYSAEREAKRERARAAADTSDAMDISREEEDEDEEDEEDDDEPEQVVDISMVPMADMLNARPGDYHNARLFYLPDQLEMRSTCEIKAGEQIFNTFGDPPNSDLLRRYGYVDLDAAAPEYKEDGADELDNPNDNVEIPWSYLIKAVLKRRQGVTEETLKQRLAWFEERGLMPDESAAIDHIHLKLPTEGAEAIEEYIKEASEIPELFSVARLLFATELRVAKAQRQEELPEATWSTMLKEESSSETKEPIPCGRVVLEAIQDRLQSYPATLKESEKAYKDLPTDLDEGKRNLRNALIVRIGEQRILVRLQRMLEVLLESLEAPASGSAAQGKRKGASSSQNGSGKKSKSA